MPPKADHMELLVLVWIDHMELLRRDIKDEGTNISNILGWVVFCMEFSLL